MTYTQALEYIHSFDKFGSKLGLERILKLLDLMGNPQKSLKFVHIAGTNGKGSTTMMCANVLKESGYKVGTYISPFVLEFRERIQICGQMIPQTDLAQLVEQIAPLVKKLNDDGDVLTEFEIVTCIALLYFCNQKCDVVCMEVGLGGRFDATNVIENPLVSVITSISLDHTQILGDTTDKIAFEKCGIIKQNCPCVTYPCQDIDALATIMEQCQAKNSTLVMPSKNAIEILQSDLSGNRFIYDETEFKTSLLGNHQIYNAVTAIETLKQLVYKGFNITKQSLLRGIENTTFPARCEILQKSPLVILDGAHNESGIKTLTALIDDMGTKVNVIMGILKDKEVDIAVS
ncbi:MAG: bifunctional folylpolyglutamate synthase/dihydrofolate synthase, partial [Oscillospiraceae bacterium]|nr:bifunctional folylpolyglutamate synthase/dihydrofolate synthase [Oscillospiraceae bacterium]